MSRREPRYDVPKKAPGSLRLVQEFLNTRNAEADLEWLDSPAALRRWLADRDFGSVRVSRADLERAREVREALRELVRARGGGTSNRQAARLLNRVADDASLGAAAGGVSGALGRILLLTAVAIVEGRWQRLKTCPNCRWAFYDYSRNCSAKWCSMTLCGNRLKTRSYYRRRREL